MKRTSSLTRLIFPALLAVVPACGDDPKCIQLQLECRGVCVDVMISNDNCGTCGHACGTGQACVAAECQADCTAPEEACDGVCVNTQTSAAHCGDCGNACAAGLDCVAGQCARPLALLQTSLMDRTVDRDLYLVEDISFDLTKLNPQSFASSTVIDHAILPNGDVLMVAAQDTEDVTELYRVSPRGGAPVKISAPLVDGGDVQPGLTVSADGTKVLYRADQDVDDIIDLYAVTLANPGVAVKVNGTLTEGGGVSPVVAISADGRRAAYVADQDAVDQHEAYTVDLSAAAPGASVKLNPDLGGFGEVWDLQMSRNGSRVVLRVATFVMTLAVVDTATPGVAEQVVNSDGGEGYIEAYSLAPDGSSVTYTYSPNFLNASLWHAPLAAPPYDSVRLADGSTGLDVRADFAVTADRARVYFRQVDDTIGIKRLYRVDVANPLAATRISSDAMDGTAEVTDFALGRNGQSLAFRGSADGAEGGNPRPGFDPQDDFEIVAPELFHVDLSAAAPGVPVLLTPPFDKGDEGIGSGYLVLDGGRVIFRADYEQTGFSDAYLTAAATAGTVRKVSPPLDQTTDATDVSILTRF